MSALNRWSCCFVFLCTVGAQAQDTIMAPPSEPVEAPMLRSTATSSLSRPLWAPSSLLDLGFIKLRPNVLYRYLSTEDLPLGAERIDSQIQSVRLTIAADIGQHWSLNYAPSWTAYSEDAMDDTFDQSFGLEGAGVIAGWGMTFSERFSLASPLLTETAQQVEQHTWQTSIGAARTFGSRYGVDLRFSLAENYTDVAPDTRDWSTQDWLTAYFSQELNVGIGPGFGYVEVANSPDRQYQRFLARLNWQVSERLSMAVKGGFEFWQVDSVNGQEFEQPAYDGSLIYQPFETTTLSVSFAQGFNSSSYIADQLTTNTGWNIGISQRLLKHLYFSGGWSMSETEYDAATTTPTPTDGPSTSPPSPPGRQDRVETFHGRLTAQLFQRLSVALTYQKSKNRTNVDGYGYQTTQLGIEVGCHF
jgi:hypothetical protein